MVLKDFGMQSLRTSCFLIAGFNWGSKVGIVWAFGGVDSGIV